MSDVLSVDVPAGGGECFHSRGTPCGIHLTEPEDATVADLLARGLRPCYPCAEYYGLAIHPDELPLITLDDEVKVNPGREGAQKAMLGAILRRVGELYQDHDTVAISLEIEGDGDE